ncbi:MAG: HD domain-containing protein [Myxococcota bacterium]
MRQTLPSTSTPVLAAGFLVLKVRQRVRRMGQILGIRRPTPLPPEALTPPDSALAKRADELAMDAYSGALLRHSQRTWGYAVAVAAHESLSPDPEALYVACLLHDLGLTPRFAGEEPFELRGANAGRALCHPDEKADIVHEAIALHTSLRAALGPPEVRLVQSGSGGDLAGLDAELVHRETDRMIRARWPKPEGDVDDVLWALRRETKAHPKSPGAGLIRVGFEREAKAYQRKLR